MSFMYLSANYRIGLLLVLSVLLVITAVASRKSAHNLTSSLKHGTFSVTLRIPFTVLSDGLSGRLPV